MHLLSLSVFMVITATLSSCTKVKTQDLNGTVLISKRRGKRYLDFTKGTRMSWRCNVKNNILKVNTLWAYGFGFRANFPFPDKSERRRPFFKREVFQGITDVLDAHGLDGKACMLKSFCSAHLSTDAELGNGMLFKLLKLLFTKSTTCESRCKSSFEFRVNTKNYIIRKPTIWANGYGFRCNYPIENDKGIRPFLRDTYEVLGDLMDNYIDDKACTSMIKAYCGDYLDDGTQPQKGMFFKLLKYIFTLNDEDRRHFPYLHHGNCAQILHSHCPLSFNNISPYTDDV